MEAKETVELYHKRYLEYEKAFEGEAEEEEKLNEQLIEVVKKADNFEDAEFKDIVVELLLNKAMKRADVSTSALRFHMAVDFYNTLGKEDLPKEILEDYDKLPIKEQIKIYHSIENGEFVRNVKEEPQIEKQQLKQYFDVLQNQYGE